MPQVALVAPSVWYRHATRSLFSKPPASAQIRANDPEAPSYDRDGDSSSSLFTDDSYTQYPNTASTEASALMPDDSSDSTYGFNPNF